MFDNAFFLSFLTFLIGLIVGHRFALFRDKRKEFNEACVPLYVQLSNGITTSNTSAYPEKLQLELFTSHIPYFKKRSYKVAVHNFNSALIADRESIQWDSEIVEHVIAPGYISQSKVSAEKLLPFLERI